MNLLAFDLGAESGRAVLGRFDGRRLALEVLHRFPNGPLRVGQRFYWDALRLFSELVQGVKAAAGHGELASLGVDTWGVDFALLGANGELLGNPRHYRDPHTETILKEAFQIVPAAEVFAATGIQFLRFNTLFQLLALKRDHSPLLDAARHLLLMPDLFHHWLGGEAANEYTNASTTQVLDPRTQSWDMSLIERFGLPTNLFGRLVQPGTRLGTLATAIQSENGVGPVPIIAPATHDTGAAVAAVPAIGKNWAYLSSGTWSLLGVELDRPLINEAVRTDNFTNEGGVGGTTRFLKNIMGLWLVQECRRAWQRDGHDYGYDELVSLAKAEPPLVSLVDPDHPSFMLPAHMPTALADFCQRTNQPVPASPGAFIRCALESLALKYRWVLEGIQKHTGLKVEMLHIVGGGSQNELLNQWTASACGIPVQAGPVEATALGNLLTQLLGLGHIADLAQGREIIGRSFPQTTFEPKEQAPWDVAYLRFLSMAG